MPHEKDTRRHESAPQGKRTGREQAEPRNQPGEFADDLVTNRFTPPPDPGEKQKKED